MQYFLRLLLRYSAFALPLLSIPMIASAHEVYVLDSATIIKDVAAVSPNPFLAISNNYNSFILWGLVSMNTIVLVFLLSVFRPLEYKLTPIFARGKKYAAPVARITLGLSLILCAYNQGLFGPELPIPQFAHTFAPLVTIVLYSSGILITVGFLTRYATLAALSMYIWGVLFYGTYMLNYANYFGEILIILALGGGYLSVDGRRAHELSEVWKQRVQHLEKYVFLILRISFGIAIIFASYYAKFSHSRLAIDTVTQYHLTNYFPFDTLFVVLGAFIIETIIGIFYIIGFELRWTALFFLFWITLSLFYFGESVWPHLILIGLNITFLLHGYDRYSIEGRVFKKRHLEPML